MKFTFPTLLAFLATPALLHAQVSLAPAAPLANHDAAPVTIFKLLVSGGWVMVPLVALSIITVMLVLVYLFTLRRGCIVSGRFMHTADVLLKKRDYTGLLAITSRHSESIARISQRTLDFITKNPEANMQTVREIAETEGSSQAASMQHRIVYLADIGMLSPMIGLLGTVFGMIESFGVLASKQTVDASRNILLAKGVSQALVATASGLVLGIIAMAFYALFRGRVQSLIADLEIASTHFISVLSLNFEKKSVIGRSRFAPQDDEF